MSDLLSNVVVPVADPEDAASTAAAAVPRLAAAGGRATAVYVVKKAGGAPDSAPMDARREVAAEAFEAFDAQCADADVPFDSKIVYNTDVAQGVFAAAAEIDATAIVFTPRKAGRIARLLSGDTALKMVTENDRPVVALADE